MATYRSDVLEDLARQLAFAPAEKRRDHCEAAELLYWQIDPDRSYPYDFVVYRITGYRPDAEEEEITLAGEAIRHDLPVLVEQLSETLGDTVEGYTPRPLDLDEVCDRLNVSAKTISRYRKRGLFARRLVFPGGKKRLAFLPASVERFIENRGEQTKKAAGFSRIDEETRHAILTRARRIRSRVDASMFAVAHHLAPKYGRSVEAVRLLLLKHDESDPRFAIFRDRRPPLSEREHRVIYRAYSRGIEVSRLCERFGKTRDAIYRAVNLGRAYELRRIRIHYVANPTFDRPDAEEVILGSALPPEDATVDGRPLSPGDAPLLDAASERKLFVRYNYLKHRAIRVRGQLDPHRPKSTDLDAIETYLRRAATIKNRIMRANHRLVVSVARQHHAELGASGERSLDEWISEGHRVLARAVESFDVAKGNRFSTYLTWALMRQFAWAESARSEAVSLDSPAARADAGFITRDTASAEEADTEQDRHTLDQLFTVLDDRERRVVSQHFGLPAEGDDESGPHTLAEIADRLGISTERARQIEHRAIAKLRQRARKLELPLPTVEGPGR